MTASAGIYFPDCRPFLLPTHSVLCRVAVGPDGHVKLRSVGAGDDVLCPVSVYPAGGKTSDLCADDSYASRPSCVRKAHQGVAVRDVKRVANERHSEWRAKVGQKCGSNVGHSIAVSVA